LSADPRTSNGIESWHNQLSNSVGASHPTIWKLIDELKNELTLSEQRLDRFSIVNKPPRRNNSYLRRDINYKNLVSKYGTLNDFDFLKNIARIIRLDNNNVVFEDDDE
jgi:hypothetical protein